MKKTNWFLKTGLMSGLFFLAQKAFADIPPGPGFIHISDKYGYVPLALFIICGLVIIFIVLVVWLVARGIKRRRRKNKEIVNK